MTTQRTTRAAPTVDRREEWATVFDERPLAGERVVVVGGGIGGLATAPYLGRAGADVEVIEQHGQLGGAAGRIEVDGFTFDTGPSWYLMPDVFERYFGQFGRAPDDFYSLERLDPHYRIRFKDGAESRPADDSSEPGPRAPGETVDVSPSIEDNVALFESYEDGAGEALRAYLDEAAHTYEVGMERFVYEDRPRFRDYLDWDVLRSARGLTLLGSMQDHVEEYFDHPKLQQIVQYTLVFLGGSPHNTPALYNLMSHVDFELGVYYPEEGGLYRVVEALRDLGAEYGVEYTTEESVRGLRAASDGDGVVADTGARTLDADRVVCNANPAHVECDLLPAGVGRNEEYWDSRTYAPSAYMLYLGVEGEVDPLEHHTLVLPTDWDQHFERIFDDPAWPDDPAYYVNVPSKTDDTVAPEGCHTVVVLVPIAPDLDDDAAARAAFREQVLDDLATYTGVELRGRIRVEREACVSEFANRLNAPQGTALGLAHTLRQTGPFRPSHRAPLDATYYVGGYTTPGIGVPMCLISAEHTARAVLDDV